MLGPDGGGLAFGKILLVAIWRLAHIWCWLEAGSLGDQQGGHSVISARDDSGAEPGQR